MSVLTYDRVQRCLGTDIFPQGGLEMTGLWEAKQELVGGSPEAPSGGWELGQPERPTGEKWSRDGLESLCPLFDHKSSNQGSPNPALQPREQEGCRGWGEEGCRLGWGSRDRVGSFAGARSPSASRPAGRGRAAASPSRCLEPRLGPSRSLRSALPPVLFYFIILSD